jgi:MFS family permease
MPQPAWPERRRAYYTLVVLTLALLIATIDKGILSVLVEYIKRDLHVTDTEFSVLSGFAFVFFYALLGLPIARLADRHSRRLIIGIGIAFWSVTTVLSGVAQSFQQLFWARVAVGAGESALAPATYSILTDSFPRDKLPMAIAVLSLGFVCGGGFSLLAGGAALQAAAALGAVTLPVVGTLRSWQLVFFLVGVPGLAVALMMATVTEPGRRGFLPGSAGARPDRVPVRVIARFLRNDWRTFVPIFAAMGIKTLLAFGAALWTPAFFVRTYGWSMQQSGYRLGLAVLIVSPLGLFAGGWLAAYYERRGREDANLRVLQMATVAVLPTSILYPLMPNPSAALALYVLNFFFASVGIGPGNAALQIVTPNQMRGQIRALFQLVFNFVGFAIGPVFVALFTDHVFHGPSGIRYSLSTAAAITCPIAVALTWWGMRPYARSVARAAAWD